MMRLPNEVMAQISALQWLDAPQIKAEFGELIPDAMKCQRADVLRMLVIYRLQENFYRLKLPERVIKTLDRSVLGDRLFHAPADDVGKAAKKLTRNYKGKDYDVFLMADGSVEYDGKRYGSLTAVAKEITGTHWNGPHFFGVKKQ